MDKGQEGVVVFVVKLVVWSDMVAEYYFFEVPFCCFDFTVVVD